MDVVHQEGREAARAAATRSTTPPVVVAVARAAGRPRLDRRAPRPPTWPRTSRRSWRPTHDPAPDRSCRSPARPRGSGTSGRSRSAPTRWRSSWASSLRSGSGERRWVARGGTRGQIGDIALWAVPAGLIGARLCHVATDHDLYFGDGRDPIDALEIWQGGLGIWGAIAGGLRRRVVLLPPARHPAPARSPTRWPRACCSRRPSAASATTSTRSCSAGPPTCRGASRSTPAHRPAGYEQFATVPPTFLYEALWNLAGDRACCSGRPAVPARLRPGVRALRDALHPGRGWIEDLRIDPIELDDVGGLRFSVWTSIVLFVLARRRTSSWSAGGTPSRTAASPRRTPTARPATPRTTPQTSSETAEARRPAEDTGRTDLAGTDRTGPDGSPRE